MSALQGPLSRWSPLVADFPREIAETLAPWMESLARAIGPLRAHVVVGEGDPDGVDGVTRRAPLDRLLDTERLLATEIPDEFVRRAAQSELLFHALALRETKPPRASLMLVDAGPAQLGAPRLVHLAMVLVLAERAREANARFAWALLQDPPVEGRAPKLVLGAEAPLPALLILDRRALPPSADDRAAWEEFARRAGWDDLWVIGHDVTPSKKLRGGAVRVRDPVLRGVARLDVEVEHGGRVVHRALALPETTTQVKVLRDPRSLFAAKPAPPARAAGSERPDYTPASAPIILCGGRKLLCRNAIGDPLIFTLPTGGLKTGRPKRWSCPRGEQVIAAGWHRRRLVLLTRREGALLRFDWKGDVFPIGRATLRSEDPSLFASIPERAPEDGLLTMHFPGDSSERGSAVLRLDDGRVLHIRPDGVARVWRPSSLLLAEVRGRIVLACTSLEHHPPDVPGVEVALFGDNRRRALFGSTRYPLRAASTCDPSELLWRIEALEGAEIPLLRGEQPFAVVAETMPPFEPQILVLDAERRAIFRCGPTARRPMLSYDEPLLGAALSSDGWELAVVAASGALRVYHLPGLIPTVARGALEPLP